MEYGADLYGSLVVKSPLKMATSLMEMSRCMAYEEIKNKYMFIQLKEQVESGIIHMSKLKDKRFLSEYKNSLDVKVIIQMYPDIINNLDMNEDKYLVRLKVEKYLKEDAIRFSQEYKRNFNDFRMNLKMEHPQTFMRIKAISKIIGMSSNLY